MELEKLAVIGIVGYVIYKVWENRQVVGPDGVVRTACDLQSDQVAVPDNFGLPSPGTALLNVQIGPIATRLNPATQQQAGQPYILPTR
jgi:hypothetical protein